MMEETQTDTTPPLLLRLARPRGFCAGVERAVRIVEESLRRFGTPIYVRHPIVHNRRVVAALEAKGARFVENLDEVPKGAHVIFSAHGVAPQVKKDAKALGLAQIDATCPLVSKVHAEMRRHVQHGRHVLFIGHTGHPEVIGTMGHAPEGACTLVETPQDAQNVRPPSPDKLAYITQTTLSVDETDEIIGILKVRFPDIMSPTSDDICYATTNRQNAVKALAADCDVFLIVGAPHSSNACRLVETASNAGSKAVHLVESVDDLPWPLLEKARICALSAGASAPEIIVQEIIDSLKARFRLRVENTHEGPREDAVFNLPAELRD